MSMANNPPSSQPSNAIGHATKVDGNIVQSPSTCSCTKISNMHLFHEMKQNFATVPDHIVWQYVTENCHNRPKCVQGLKEEAENHPGSVQAYPQALRNNNKKPPPRLLPNDVKVLSNNLSSSNVNEFVDQPKSEVSLLSDSRCSDKQTHANGIDSLSKVNVPERPNTLNISKLSDSYQQLNLRPTRSAPPPPTASNPFFPHTSSIEESDTVNVSLNVTVSPASNRPPVRPQRSVRHTTAISVQPEAPPFNKDGQQSPRSFTSVNFTLRQPTSTPQSPIDISAGPSPSLTYSSSSYDARKGYQSRLQITVGTSGSSISASRIRPTLYNSHGDCNDSSYSSNSSNVDEGIFGILGESHQINKGQKHQFSHHKADHKNTRVLSMNSGNQDRREMFANENINKIPSNNAKSSRRIDRNPLTTNFINTNKNVANLVSYRRKLEKFENDNTEGGGDKEFYADEIAQRKSNVRHITMHHRHRRASPQNNTEDHEKPQILSTTPLPTTTPASTASPTTQHHTINAIVDLNQNSSSDKIFYEKSELSDALNAIENQNSNSNEQIIILSNTEELDSNSDSSVHDSSSDLKEGDSFMLSDEPRVLPLRPIIRGPYDDEHQGEMSVVYAEPHTEVRLNCEVDLDVATTVWMKDGQCRSPKFKNMYDIDKVLTTQFDVFHSYNVNEYLYLHNLSVDKRFRGLNIGSQMLDVCKDFCRGFNIKLMHGIFTSDFSNKIGEDLEFNVDLAVSFDELRKARPELNIQDIKSKKMALKSFVL